MTAYTLLRLLHGYWRWAVVLTGLFVLVRAIRGVTSKPATWSALDDRGAVAWVGAVDLQLLLGLVLYFFLSPFSSAVFQDFALSMHSKVTRFFGVEHQFGMLFAVAAAHWGRWRSKKLQDPAQKQRALLRAAVIFFILVLVAVPWPFRDMIGRPWFRTEW